jgi:peptidoglycan/xylan/chitin deacetylase (PgdA/CDA1 family)
MRPLVLMYHGVGHRSRASDPYNLFVPAAMLHTQLSHLLAEGWRPLRLAELLTDLRADAPRADASADLPAGGAGPAPAGGRRFLLTFDDGYRAIYDEALPLLTELGVPATVFVCAGLLGGTSCWMPEMPAEPLLTASQVRKLHSAGLDIGVHGLDHIPLVGLPAEELAAQTAGATDLLADLLGERPRAFAYPSGRHDQAARLAVAAAGLEAAFGTHHGRGRWAVPRVDVNATDNARSFRLKLWRCYPVLRRVTGALPGLRPALHLLVGEAARDSDGRGRPAAPRPGLVARPETDGERQPSRRRRQWRR